MIVDTDYQEGVSCAMLRSLCKVVVGGKITDANDQKVLGELVDMYLDESLLAENSTEPFLDIVQITEIEQMER